MSGGGETLQERLRRAVEACRDAAFETGYMVDPPAPKARARVARGSGWLDEWEEEREREPGASVAGAAPAVRG